MPDYQTYKFSSTTTILAEPSALKFKLSDVDQLLIEKIWDAEKKRTNGRLFNGELFSITSWDEQQVVGSFVEYKLFLAQKKAPELAKKFPIHPLSVSGLTIRGDNVLFAQRAADVAQDPLCYELAPSGGVDPSSLVGNHIDLTKQLMLELQEETGLITEMIKGIHPFALIRDLQSRLTEICVEIIVDEIKGKIVNHPIDEYIQFFWIPKKDIPHFIAKHHDRFVPMSLHVLKIKGLM